MDNLAYYFRSFPLNHNPSHLFRGPWRSITTRGPHSALRIHKSLYFQVELFVFHGPAMPKPHCHPNVEQILVHLAGDYDLRINGAPAVDADHLPRPPEQVSRWWRRGYRIGPTDMQALSVNEGAASFLSVQNWLDGDAKTLSDYWVMQ